MLTADHPPLHQPRMLEHAHMFRHRVERQTMAPREIGHPGFIRAGQLAEHSPPRTMTQRKEGLVQRGIQTLTHEGEYYWLGGQKSKQARGHAAGLVGGLTAARLMALTVQDRVIRLEMRLRLREVLPADLQARIPELTPRQLIGLRFASDAELPQLMRQVLAGSLGNTTEIKKAITQWQGDYLRA